jgi:hypothetical protein
MRTSLNRVERIEKYLDGTLSNEDRLLFDATRILDQSLSKDVDLQKDVYRIITFSGREQLRMELNALSARISADPAHSRLWTTIIKIFKTH